MPGNSKPSDFKKRLRKLPAQLALALVNTTAILIIAAAILVIVAFNRVEHAAGKIASTMTSAVLSRVEAEPERLFANLQATGSEIRELRTAIKEGGLQHAEEIEQQIETLTDAVAGLREDVGKLTEAKVRLSDEAIRELGKSVIDAVLQLRNCQTVQAQLPR